MYNSLLESGRKNGVEDLVKEILNDLNGMLEYIEQKGNTEKSGSYVPDEFII